MNEKVHLVLLPGLDGSGVLFEPLMNELPGHIIPLTVPYPSKGPNCYEDVMPVALGVLPRSEPYVILGWSFSGPVAVRIASQRPPGLMGLILCATFVRNPVPWMPAFMSFLVRPLLLRLFPRFSIIKSAVAGYSNPLMRSLLDRANRSVSPKALAERLRSILSVDVSMELGRCKCPVLYLQSSRDMVVPPLNVRCVQRICPEVLVRVVDGPHLALAVSPKPASHHIISFIDSIMDGDGNWNKSCV